MKQSKLLMGVVILLVFLLIIGGTSILGETIGKWAELLSLVVVAAILLVILIRTREGD